MKKLYLLLFVFILILSGCSPTDVPGDTSAEVTQEPAPESYIIVADGVSNFTLIRPDVFDSRPLQSTLDLRHAINDKYSVDIEIKTDWSKDNKTNATVTSGEDVLEILVGNTNRAESRAIAEEYPNIKCGYVIKAVNGKIVIWGTDNASLTSAIEYFTTEMLGENALTVPKDFLCVWDLSGEGMPLDLIANNYTVITKQNAPDRIWSSASLLADTVWELSGVRVPVTTDSKSLTAFCVAKGLPPTRMILFSVILMR